MGGDNDRREQEVTGRDLGDAQALQEGIAFGV
jgi:hypothetical protein